MDELIKQIATKFGIPESVAQQAVGMLMSFLKKEGSSELFGQIAAAIPGANQAADQAPEPQEAAGLLGKVAGMLGGTTGKGAALASALTNTGLNSDQLAGFGEVVINFIKEKAGPQVVDQLLSQVPMLKSLLSK
jgi:hypothetical protein